MSTRAHIIDRTDVVKGSIGNEDVKEALYDFLTDNDVGICEYVNPNGGDFCGWEIEKSDLVEFIKDLESTAIPYPESLKDKEKCETLADPENLIRWLKELVETSAGHSRAFVEWF